jgi:hypothetical protein
VYVGVGSVAYVVVAYRDPQCVEGGRGACGGGACVRAGCGRDVQRWNEWAITQRDFIINGKPGITTDDYETIRSAFLVRATVHEPR